MSLLLPSKHPSCPTHRTTEKTNKNPVRSFFDKQLCCYQCTTWATKEELPHKRTGRSPPQISTNLKSPPTLPRRRKLVHHFLYNSQQASSSLHAHTHTHTQALFAPLSVSGTRPPTAELRCRQTHPLSRSRTVLCGTTLPPREASPADDPTLSSLLLLFLLQHPGSGRGYGKGFGERSAVLNGLRCGKRAVFEAFPEGLF